MATPAVSSAAPSRESTSIQLGPKGLNSYDSAVSWLAAFLFLLIPAVGILLAVWLGNRVYIQQISIPVILDDLGGGVPDGVIGESMQLDSPEQQNIPQESDISSPDIMEAVTAVTELAAEQQADIADPTLSENAEENGGTRSEGTGTRLGRGQGDGRYGVARAERWELRFEEGLTLDEYARQMDFFRIELGVLGPTNVIYYASNLSAGAPSRREGTRKDEQRLYMAWQQGQLVEADRQLLARAGIDGGGKVILHFVPDDVENMLAFLELQYRNREAKEIRKTRFAIVPGGGGYQITVIDQTYL